MTAPDDKQNQPEKTVGLEVFGINEIEPNEGTGFTLMIKPGALEVNTALQDVREQYGETFTFSSRAQAERYAVQLAQNDGDLRVQSVAHNDSADVDGYLLAAHSPSINEPASVDGAQMTFDVGANLYGRLGEVIVTHGAKPPALTNFIRNDLDLENRTLKHGLKIDIEYSEAITATDQEDKQIRWIPDCQIEATDGWNGELLERYWCEIKTGDASFQRHQIETMEQFAVEHRVLKAKVRIDDLPDNYTVAFHEVSPPTDKEY